MRTRKVEALIGALEPVAIDHGFEIVDAEILGSSKAPILRIYIDKLDPDFGINLDDISEAQQEWLEPIVDEVDIISGNYMLEVSSPGIDRPLRTREHFERFAGEDVKITCEPASGGASSRRRFSGRLEGVEGDLVIVASGDERFEIDLSSIQRAHVVGKVDFKRLPEEGE